MGRFAVKKLLAYYQTLSRRGLLSNKEQVIMDRGS